jgi:hypothetical protein
VDAQGGEDGIAVLITIPYHVRDAERLRRMHGKRCTIWGHEACASRLTKRVGFHPITPETELPAGVRAHAIGSPRRQEQPLWIPSHKALAFGDASTQSECSSPTVPPFSATDARSSPPRCARSRGIAAAPRPPDLQT